MYGPSGSSKYLCEAAAEYEAAMRAMPRESVGVCDRSGKQSDMPVSPRERRGWPLCESVLQLGTGRVQPGMRPRLPTSGRQGRHYALH